MTSAFIIAAPAHFVLLFTPVRLHLNGAHLTEKYQSLIPLYYVDGLLNCAVIAGKLSTNKEILF